MSYTPTCRFPSPWTRPELRAITTPPGVGSSRAREDAALTINSTYFGLLAEFGEANIPLEKVATKYFGLSYAEARRRAPAKMLPGRAFRLGGQKSPWLVSAMDLAEVIDVQRERAR